MNRTYKGIEAESTRKRQNQHDRLHRGHRKKEDKKKIDKKHGGMKGRKTALVMAVHLSLLPNQCFLRHFPLYQNLSFRRHF